MRFPAWRMLAQRFSYRQLLYVVVLRAAYVALKGPRVGWGKLHRTGTMVTAISGAVIPLPTRTAGDIPPLRAAA